MSSAVHPEASDRIKKTRGGGTRRARAPHCSLWITFGIFDERIGSHVQQHLGNPVAPGDGTFVKGSSGSTLLCSHLVGVNTGLQQLGRRETQARQQT